MGNFIIIIILVNFIISNIYGFSYLPMNSNTSVITCLLNLLSKLPHGETLHFVFNNFTSIHLPVYTGNPHTIININKPVMLTLNFTNYNYIICINEFDHLAHIIMKLKSSPIWHESDSPRGKFILFTFTKNNFNEIARLLWRFDIINFIVIGPDSFDNSTKIFTANPFDRTNECGKFVRMRYVQSCNHIFNITLTSIIKKLNGCPLKMINSFNIFNFKTDRREYYMITMGLLDLIAKLLNTKILFAKTSKIDEILRNQSEDVTFYPFLFRLFDLYEKYDVSDYFVHDSSMWVIPKSLKISGFRIVTSVFDDKAWYAILAILFATAFIIRVTATYVHEKEAFKNLCRCLLAILVLSFGSVSSLLPKSNSFRILFSFYLLYIMQVSNIFQGKLISVLTNPGNEPTITTLEEFSNLGLPVSTSIRTQEILVARATEPILERISKKIIAEEKWSMVDSTIKTAYDRNQTTFCQHAIINRMYPILESKLDIIQGSTGLLSLELTVSMRKGHYFLPILNKLIRTTIECGFSKKLFNEVVDKNRIQTEDNNNRITLTLGHLYGIFFWWAIGISIAGLAFIAEIHNVL